MAYDSKDHGFWGACLVRPFIKKKIPKFVRLNAENCFICFLYFFCFMYSLCVFGLRGYLARSLHLEPFGSMFTRHLKIHSLLTFWLFCNDLVGEWGSIVLLVILDPLLIYLAFDWDCFYKALEFCFWIEFRWISTSL